MGRAGAFAGTPALTLGVLAVVSNESIRGHTGDLLRIGLVFVPSVLIALGWLALQVTAVVKAAGASRTAAERGSRCRRNRSTGPNHGALRASR